MGSGPIIVDLAVTKLLPQEKAMLKHPGVGGVILFSRNFSSTEQLADLVNSIKDVAGRDLLVCVDQEGGRVQRFREGFTRLPDFRTMGQIYDVDPSRGLELAWSSGYVMATELMAYGIDFSLSPVLDIDRRLNECIGDRSYHGQIEVIIQLATRQIKGIQEAGMIAVAKHFPGHGGVSTDSHYAVATDSRDRDIIFDEDIVPFKQLIQQNMLAGVLVSHVIFSDIDPKQVGYSSFWLKTLLREKLKFDGVIFSDDLTMAGAKIGGDLSDRAIQALEAGCDKILICNRGNPIDDVLLQLEPYIEKNCQGIVHDKLERDHVPFELDKKKWQHAKSAIESLLSDNEVTKT